MLQLHKLGIKFKIAIFAVILSFLYMLAKDHVNPAPGYEAQAAADLERAIVFLTISASIAGLILAHHLWLYMVLPAISITTKSAAAVTKSAVTTTQQVKGKVSEKRQHKKISKITEDLRNYKELRDEGVLSEADYQKKVAELKRSFQ